MRGSVLALIAVAAAAPAWAGERLQVPQLPGWVAVASYAGPDSEVTELVPQGEEEEGWSRRIVVQAFRDAAMAVPAFLDLAAANSAALCAEGASAEPARVGRLGPLDAGSRLISCGRTKAEGRGEVALHYAIRGRDAFYVVVRAWRGSPFAAGAGPVSRRELDDWIGFMRAVTVCDSRDPSRPCR
ncbi:MAG: hypothetical protein AB1918_17215 [Pseudomonadota bacterium]